MTKDKKKITSDDLKLWYQIVDKVEPIQKRDNPDIKDQEQSSIDAGSITVSYTHLTLPTIYSV